MGERVQHGAGGAEIGGVDAFGEPVADLRQRLSCFVTLALRRPQSRQAQRNTQLSELGSLIGSHLARLAQADLGLLRTPIQARQEQGLALDAQQLWDLPEPAVLTGSGMGNRAIHGLDRLSGVAETGEPQGQSGLELLMGNAPAGLSGGIEGGE